MVNPAIEQAKADSSIIPSWAGEGWWIWGAGLLQTSLQSAAGASCIDLLDCAPKHGYPKGYFSQIRFYVKGLHKQRNYFICVACK